MWYYKAFIFFKFNLVNPAETLLKSRKEISMCEKSIHNIKNDRAKILVHKDI